MIYSILIGLFRITVKLFFSSFKVKGKENIPADEPLLIVANHPSTFMDPIVMAVAMKRKIHFIAKGEAFRSKFAQWILPKFNMIPIYRKEHDPEKVHMNDETFHKVYEILEQGGAVIIFPEGISLTDRILKKLKTGAMRMALGAEERNDFKLNVHVLPMGLNFSNPHKFRSKLQINIGKPIRVADYKDRFHQDSFKAAHALKDDIRTAIEQLTLCIDSLTTDQLIFRVETIYKRNFLDAENRQNLETEEEFRIAELIRDRVYYFIKNDITRVEQMSELLDDHAELLKVLDLDGEVIKVVGGDKRKFNFKDYLYYFFGFPIFLFGFINNIIPYKIPGIIARKIDGRDAFTGSILMTSGAFVFLIFYVFQSLIVYHWSSDIILTAIYLLLLPISGLMAFNYNEKLKNQLQTIRYHRLIDSGDKKAIELLELEVAIVSQIESAMKYFESAELNIPKNVEHSI